MKIKVCVPSYKRPRVKTLDYYPAASVYVCETEADEYREANKGADIVALPVGVQGNLCRARNWILDNESEKFEAIIIIDDDIKGFYHFSQKNRYLIEPMEVDAFLQKWAFLAKELGVKFFGLNVNTDAQNYREYTPFSTLSYIGGPFQGFLKGNVLRYDEGLPLKEDYDMTLQQLNKYRKVLRFNMACYSAKQSKQKGGCAAYRNFDRELEQLRKLQKKWGTKIVKFDEREDRSNKATKKKKVIDYNPVIRVPIRGV